MLHEDRQGPSQQMTWVAKRMHGLPEPKGQKCLEIEQMKERKKKNHYDVSWAL